MDPGRANRPSSPPAQEAAGVPSPAVPQAQGDQKLPCGCLRNARNLVVCIDGTSNQFGQKNTNVIELYHQLDKDTMQLTYYNSGIGTYAKPSWRSLKYLKLRLDNKIDLAIAWNFEHIVMGAYRWLVDNYKEGDRIFLFGFSRGAYQARTIAAMIEKVGLIHKGNEEQIPFAYELYAGYEIGAPKPKKSATRNTAVDAALRSGTPEQTKEALPPAESFKQTFSRKGVRVHFIGVWDTVSSIGVVRDKNLPGTDSVDKICCYFRHALALDERRVKFLPEYSGGGVMLLKEQGPLKEQTTLSDPLPRTSGEVQRAPVSQDIINPRIKEVWFPGTHSDIGGGNVANDTLDRGHAALLWMSYEANTAGVKTHPSRVDWKWENLSEVHESLTLSWLPLEYLPVKRLSYKTATSTVTWRVHRGQGRIIKPGQKIHASIAFCKDPYRPKAILPPNATRRWDELVGCGQRSDLQWTQGWEHLLEMDIFNQSTASQCVDMLNEIGNTEIDPSLWLHRLEVMTWSEEGRLTLLSVEDVARRLLKAVAAFSNIQHQVTASYIVVKLGQLDVLAMFLREHNTFSELLLQLVLDEPLSKRRLGLGAFFLDDDHFRKELLDQKPQSKQQDDRSSEIDSQLVCILLQRLSDMPEQQGPPAETTAFQRHASQMLGQLAIHDDSRAKILHTPLLVALLKKVRANEPLPLRCDALIVLKELVKHEELCNILYELDFLSMLANCLRDDQWHIQYLTLDIMHQLGYSHNDYSKMVSHRIFDAILGAIKDELTVTQSSAMGIILNMADNDAARQMILDSSILPTFMVLPGVGTLYRSSIVLRIAAKLAKHDPDTTYSQILSPNLISLMASSWKGSYHAKAEVIRGLVDLASHDMTKFIMLGPGLTSIVYKGSQDENWYIQERTLWLIQELGKHGIFRRKILDHEIFRIMFSAMGHSDSIVQGAALQTITSLAKYNDTHHKILQSSVIFDLVDLSKSRKQNVLVKLKAIAALAKYDSLRAQILNSGFLDSLFEENGDLIDNITGKSQKNVQFIILFVLQEFIKHGDSRQGILNHNVFIILFQRLLDKHHSIRAMAVKTISELALHVDAHMKILDESVSSKLFEVIQQTSFYAHSTLQAVAALVSQDALRDSLLNSDLLKHIQDKLYDQTNYMTLLAGLDVLSQLAINTNSRNLMNLDELTEQLVKMLNNENPRIRHQTIVVFQTLVGFDDSRKKLLDIDLLFDLKWMLRGKDTEIETVQCFHEFTKHEDSREQLLGINILSELTDMLRSDSSELREIAARSLLELAQDERFLAKFSKLGIGRLRDILHKWLWASESESERQAIESAYQAVALLSSGKRSEPPGANISAERDVNAGAIPQHHKTASTQTQTQFTGQEATFALRPRSESKSAFKSHSGEAPHPSNKKVSFLVYPTSPTDVPSVTATTSSPPPVIDDRFQNSALGLAGMTKVPNDVNHESTTPSSFPPSGSVPPLVEPAVAAWRGRSPASSSDESSSVASTDETALEYWDPAEASDRTPSPIYAMVPYEVPQHVDGQPDEREDRDPQPMASELEGDLIHSSPRPNSHSQQTENGKDGESRMLDVDESNPSPPSEPVSTESELPAHIPSTTSDNPDALSNVANTAESEETGALETSGETDRSDQLPSAMNATDSPPLVTPHEEVTNDQEEAGRCKVM